MWSGILFIFVAVGMRHISPSIAACPQMPHCTKCVVMRGILTCTVCDDGYAINSDQAVCCSAGCRKDLNGFVSCHVNQTCVYEGCERGYAGQKCEPCSRSIQFCDLCRSVPGSCQLECVTCARGWYPSTSKQQCCRNPECDVCSGNNNEVCSFCKIGSSSLYNHTCGQCPNTCLAPSGGSDRCEPATGRCHFGCRANYYGSRCQILCEIPNCSTCSYNAVTNIMSCLDCADGRYGPCCTDCSSNCLHNNGQICLQNGTCIGGCKPGFRGDNCDVACDATIGLQNCAECSRYDLNCTTCKIGYWGSTCQDTCGENCEATGVTRRCQIEDGTCTDGCTSDHYRHDCSSVCTNCSTGVCDRNNGTCIDPVCDHGYYGPWCGQICPPKCAPSKSGHQYCDYKTGICTFGCMDGHFGERCTIACSQFCDADPASTDTGPMCLQSTGDCVFGCKPGFYATNCTVKCVSKCVHGTCNISTGTCAECDQTDPDYLCPNSVCPDGRFGISCLSYCPVGCARTCERFTGKCTGCKHGTWGDTCDKKCLFSNCKTCDQTYGHCSTCSARKWGFDCRYNCGFCMSDSNGVSGCNHYTGMCTHGCDTGYFGPDCANPCSKRCKHAHCNSSVNDCLEGCLLGYYGTDCQNTCPANCVGGGCDETNGHCDGACAIGFFGATCTSSCVNTCMDNTCDKYTGDCLECKLATSRPSFYCRLAACPMGFYGLHCNQTCPAGCAASCDRYTSICNGCKDGFYGQHCTVSCGRCNPIKCDQNTGDCSVCQSGYWDRICQSSCNFANCDTCVKDNGQCASCIASFYGVNNYCDRKCSVNCYPNSNSVISCSKDLGNCDSNKCQLGYWGPVCNSRCSSNCVHKMCAINNGECIMGCEDTFYGPDCTLKCSAKCKDMMCDRYGTCSAGDCMAGYYGDKCDLICNETCSDNTCGRTSGVCDLSRPSYEGILWGVDGALAFCDVIVIIIIIIRRRYQSGQTDSQRDEDEEFYEIIESELGIEEDHPSGIEQQRDGPDTRKGIGDTSDNNAVYETLDPDQIDGPDTRKGIGDTSENNAVYETLDPDQMTPSQYHTVDLHAHAECIEMRGIAHAPESTGLHDSGFDTPGSLLHPDVVSGDTNEVNYETIDPNKACHHHYDTLDSYTSKETIDMQKTTTVQESNGSDDYISTGIQK